MAEHKPRVLVVDDGETYAQVVEEQLSEVTLVRPSPEAVRIEDGPSALAFLERARDAVDLVLLDMRFDLPEERLLPVPGAHNLRRRRRYQGVAILHALRERFPRLPIVLLTAEEDLSPVDADGALSGQSMTYFLGGDDLASLRISIHRALSEAQLTLEEEGLLWGRDAGMASLRRRLAVLARGRMPLIIEGETGTGKSYLAERFVHRRSGRTGPFVVLDLSTVPSELVSAHLFGATKGAYTGAVADRKGVFEAADQGTLFIDEIQNVPIEVQKQLLLVLQESKVRRIGSTRDVPIDVKVVTASNQPLSQAVAEGRFRADLHMRLSPATRVVIPPLRERPGDLRFFASRFVELAGEDPDLSGLRAQIARAAGLAEQAPLSLRVGRDEPVARGSLSLGLSQPSWERLSEHGWAGNIRELKMVIHNLVSFTLVAAVDAMQAGVQVAASRLQIDPGLVDELLGVSAPRHSILPSSASAPAPSSPLVAVPTAAGGPGTALVEVKPAASLNAVAQDVERQYMLSLFEAFDGDFSRMAEALLGDPERARAVRLRFNQLGLKIRELRRA